MCNQNYSHNLSCLLLLLRVISFPCFLCEILVWFYKCVPFHERQSTQIDLSETEHKFHEWQKRLCDLGLDKIFNLLELTWSWFMSDFDISLRRPSSRKANMYTIQSLQSYNPAPLAVHTYTHILIIPMHIYLCVKEALGGGSMLLSWRFYHEFLEMWFS